MALNSSIYLFSIFKFAAKPLLSLFVAPYSSLSPKNQAQADVRLPSMVFCAYVVYYAMKLLLLDNALHSDRLFGTSDESEYLMTLASGYFLFDILYCIIHKDTIAFILHGQASLLFFNMSHLFHLAIVCFYVYSFALVFNFLQFYGCVFLMFEASTVMLNLAWFVKYVYKEEAGSFASLLVGGVFAAVFLLFRILFGNYMNIVYFYPDIFGLWKEKQGDMFWKTQIIVFSSINVFLFLLNFFWFYKIIAMVFCASNKDKKKN